MARPESPARQRTRWVVTLACIISLVLVSWTTPRAAQAPTPEEAAAFIASAEETLNALNARAERAGWVQATYITPDTVAIAAEARQTHIAAVIRSAKEAARFRDLQLPPEQARKLVLLRLQLTMPSPPEAAELEELTKIAASLEADYGKGVYCRRGRHGNEECLDITAIERIMRESRDPQELQDVWVGWHRVGQPMRQRYARFVELMNKGARELGFADTGALWRSKYDMPPDEFSAEVERLWQQVRPFYLSLHAYVRRRLVEKYGETVVPPHGPIPAHLLGNPWAQEWGNVYDLVAPPDRRAYDVTERLRARGMDARAMVRTGEGFFTSLGFSRLPQTFWERSLFTKPADRDVMCHASAWTIDNFDDVRLKMCIEVTEDDFHTVHHELGHVFYYLAYRQQPFLFKESANDAFHEAIGDTVALSITPSYLKAIDLIDAVPPASGDVGLLLRRALDSIAFLPFGVLIDQWRWRVFSGDIAPDAYNRAWWELRQRYQGVAPPVARTEQDFDPGAKYHVPANSSYTEYFLARILQFQFHRALCQAAGQTGPLHRCSIYGSRAAGDRLQRTLGMGASRPWPDALEALTGERRMDASAIVEYFSPLKAWLDEQNRGQKIGWD